jgi:hypothetical protein
MPRYYFHLTTGGEVLSDDDGSDLIDVDAAREEGLKAAREILSQSLVAGGQLDLTQQIDVADEAGRTLLTIPFRTAVRLEVPVDDTHAVVSASNL